MKLSAPVSIAALCSVGYALPTAENPEDGSTPAPAKIQWQPCGEIETELNDVYGAELIPLPIDCATLSVPLDYGDSRAGQLDLRLLRVNATKEPVLGSILYDSGGPGGSNVDAVAITSKGLLDVTGGNYNIIGWDPRGTGKTIPFNCSIPSGPTTPGTPPALARRDFSDITPQRNLTDYLFKKGWESAKTYADICYETMNKTGQYIGTAFVVRDMVKIIDALGEDGMLRYWGLSYGTHLGATFAAMFPERVDRMLLDAVTNPHEYQSGSWKDSLLQADKVYLAFIDECAKNPDKCTLAPYVGKNATADQVHQALTKGLETLLQTSTAQDGTVTYGYLKFLLYRALYDPSGWPDLSDMLVGLLNGTGSAAPPPTSAVPKVYSLGPNAFEGIKCSDAIWHAEKPEDILPIVQEQATISSFSDAYYDQTWRCAVWKMKAKEQYCGNFTATTKHPVLLVGGAYDPVAPLKSAFNVSAGFKDSVVVTREGYGHGLTVHPSKCVSNAVAAYFVNGTMPPPGVVCQPDQPVWEFIASLEAKK